ncbi:C-C motif chemokine 20-like [Mastacembelus armatus]|uniref:C-C motif chemokine 20-like n=1 Tax=Mastacembelus armatus TaxID=205130 RepID=UPI000E455792|nr:C-C motif chemokine 20-like [Mastacembelus armatus]
MSKRILSTGLLLLSLYVCFQFSTASRRFPTRGAIPLCCTRVSSIDISEYVMDTYTHQAANRDCVSALIFRTKDKREKVCVDPNAGWVQKFTNTKHP